MTELALLTASPEPALLTWRIKAVSEALLALLTLLALLLRLAAAGALLLFKAFAELALLVGDADTLARLANSTIKAPGAARAVLFLDAQGALLAAAFEAASSAFWPQAERIRMEGRVASRTDLDKRMTTLPRVSTESVEI